MSAGGIVHSAVMAGRIKPETMQRYWKLREKGFSQRRAAMEVGISRTTAWAWERDHEVSNGELLRKKRAEAHLNRPPVPFDELAPEAQRALEDFDYFRTRYLGRTSTPWQVEAGNEIAKLLATPYDEYVVINVPPGSGKSTTFTHDIPVWLICRDRSIRTMIGSRTNKQAQWYVRQIRRTLERPIPAEGAEATLSFDFGRFKPEDRDLWASDQFIVEQMGGQLLEDKEPTVLAISQESGFLGARADFVMWDDLVDKTNTKSPEMRANLENWYETEAESRVEPGGLFCLQGQRIAAEDLYRFALNLKLGEVDDDEQRPEWESDERARKYRHIIYPAHDEERCNGEHARGVAKAWPEGCLLDPHRLSWRKLSTLRENNPRRFEVTYQQKDVDASDQLVQWAWLEGGVGADGVLHPGCLDLERDLCELPDGLVGPLVSACAVDPSPTNWWAVQWWIYDINTQKRWLMDATRLQMQAPEFLERLSNGKYVGLAQDWQLRSNDMGLPITHWIIEQNAAQRFLLQYEFVRDWQSMHMVEIIPHSTFATNKSSEEFGVQTIGPNYKHGRVSLPWKPRSYGMKATGYLIEELMKWPEGKTDDQVMANWFFEYHLPQLEYAYDAIPEVSGVPRWVTSRFRK